MAHCLQFFVLLIFIWQGIAHQICGSAFRNSHWLHFNLVGLVKRNLCSPLRDGAFIAFDVMLEWLQFKYNSYIEQDANTSTRMERMSIAHLLDMLGSTM